MTERSGSVDLRARAGLSGGGLAIRGEKSWAVLNTFAGFMIAFEGTLASMAEVLPWWGRCLLFLVVGQGTLMLIRTDGHIQDAIIGWTTHYQNKPQ